MNGPATMWRDHDPDVRGIPATMMGMLPEEGEPVGMVAELYHQGLRHVEMNRRTDLASAGIRDIVLLREFTGWGVSVHWSLRLEQYDWRLINHFFPPAELLGEPESSLRSWKETWYLCKCIYRSGPGFIEVRDRRAGSLSRFVIDEPDYLAAVATLGPGAPLEAIPGPILADFRAEGLVIVLGRTACWLPYRVHRWPEPSMLV